MLGAYALLFDWKTCRGLTFVVILSLSALSRFLFSSNYIAHLAVNTASLPLQGIHLRTGVFNRLGLLIYHIAVCCLSHVQCSDVTSLDNPLGSASFLRFIVSSIGESHTLRSL